jgi:hypothetical protein
MIGAAIRWFRLVWPPGWAIATFALMYGVLETLHFWVRSFAPHEALAFLVLRDVLVIAALALYGAFRVVAFHPLFRPEYRKWLMLSPWSYRRPLPMGPVFPTLQDLIALALAVVIMHGTYIELRVGAVAAFTISYVVFACLILFSTRIWIEGYLLAFGLGLTIRLDAWRSDAAMVVLALLFPVALVGLWRSLTWFPWDERVEKIGKKMASIQGQQAMLVGTGWPFDHLNPQRKHAGIPTRHGVMISVLLGWWFYAVQSAGPLHDPDFRDGVAFVFIILCGAFSAARFLFYCGGYWPPISIWGRLWTGRWIIPGYDYVFVAPLCALAAMLIGIFLPRGPFSPGLVLAPFLTLVALACLTMGPRLERWRLTGDHRISSHLVQTKDFERL